MITVNDNSVQQINAALLRLESGVTQGLGSQIKNVNVKLSTDIDALKKRLSEIDIGTMVYSAGANINISSTGVISATVPTKTSQLQNDSGFITSASIPTNVSDFTNDAGYLTEDTVPQDIYYCTTAYNTAAKVANSKYGTTDFTLVDGQNYVVFIQGGNGGGSSTARTMNINGTGALPLYAGDHVLAITGNFQMDGGLYTLVYHASTDSVEAYYRVRPNPFVTTTGYQLQGSGITVTPSQYGFDRNFTFELLCQTNTNNSVTLYDWYGHTTTATCVVNGSTTAGIPNGFRGLAYFYYDSTNGNKLYIASDFLNIFGLALGTQTTTSANLGTIPIQLRNPVTTWGGQYRSSSGYNRYALNLSNSDIIGVNGFYTQDSAGGYSEGINFYRRSQTIDSVTHYYNDSMYAASGHFYFGADVDRVDTKGSETTGAQNSNAILHAAGFIQNGNNVWDNSRATSFTITVPSTAGTWATHDYTFTADHVYTFGITGAWSSTTYHGSATFALNSTSYSYNVFLFSSSGSMTGTTVQINPSSTAFRITGINGSAALGHQMTVSIIDYNK